MRLPFVALLLMGATLAAVHGEPGLTGNLAGSYVTPAAGTPLRKELLDVIRVPTEAHLGEAVVFKVDLLRATEGWAYFAGQAIQPNGNPIDYRKSKEFKKDPAGTKEAMAAGALFGGVDALLKKEGGKWKIVEITYEATEAHWFDYDKRYGTPKSLFSGLQ